MLNIADLKPGMIVSVRDSGGYFYPRCLVVTPDYLEGELRFIDLEGGFFVRPFFDDDVVEVVE